MTTPGPDAHLDADLDADLDPDLDAALVALAARARDDGPVLVALDFDGVLAPIVDDPSTSAPLPAARAAVHALARADGVRVALVSGRTLADLLTLADAPQQAALVGSHGAQVRLRGGSDDDPDAARPDVDRALLARLGAALDEVAASHPGTRVERKPAAAVLHTRLAAAEDAGVATRAALAGPATWPGVHLTVGKDVVELAVTDVTKGAALLGLRQALGVPGPGGVLYAGDDVTDERAFAVLDDDAGDLTLKVGPGATRARHRVERPQDVGAVLRRLAALLPPAPAA